MLGLVIADIIAWRGAENDGFGGSETRTCQDLSGQVGNDEETSLSSISIILSLIQGVRTGILRGYQCTVTREKPQDITVEEEHRSKDVLWRGFRLAIWTT